MNVQFRMRCVVNAATVPSGPIIIFSRLYTRVKKSYTNQYILF